MAKYRKKPIVVEAEQWCPHVDILGVCLDDHDGSWHRPHVHTLEGCLAVNLGDWIITGAKGEVCSCKPDVFKATYEAVEELV